MQAINWILLLLLTILWLIGACVILGITYLVGCSLHYGYVMSEIDWFVRALPVLITLVPSTWAIYGTGRSLWDSWRCGPSYLYPIPKKRTPKVRLRNYRGHY